MWHADAGRGWEAAKSAATERYDTLRRWPVLLSVPTDLTGDEDDVCTSRVRCTKTALSRSTAMSHPRPLATEQQQKKQTLTDPAAALASSTGRMGS